MCSWVASSISGNEGLREREREEVVLYAPLQRQELSLSAVNATAALLQPMLDFLMEDHFETKQLCVLAQC